MADVVYDVAAARAAAAHVMVDDIYEPTLAVEDRHHLLSALRLRAGAEVSATDGKGGWRLCRLRPGGDLEPASDAVRVPALAPPLCIAFAPVKGDRPEWAVQKLTELRIDRIVLLRTERSIVSWEGDRIQRHLMRLRYVARQAVMQSRNLWLPEISGVVDFEAATSWADTALAAPGGDPPNLRFPTVLVGPEGGWSSREEQAGLPAIDLGPGILRSETAAVSTGVLLCALRSGLVKPV